MTRVRKNDEHILDEAIAQVHKRNLYVMGLLTTSHPGFKQEVGGLRKEFGVPDPGFRNEDNTVNTDKILHWRRSLFGEPKKNNQWNDNLDKLLNKYKLGRNFRRYIEAYILAGIITAPPTNFSLTTKIREMNGKASREEGVITYSPLTKKEWRAVQILTRPDKRTRRKKNPDRDMQILRQSAEKGMNPFIKNDSDIVARIFESEEDESPKSDRKRVKVVRQVRRRTTREIKHRFGDT